METKIKREIDNVNPPTEKLLPAINLPKGVDAEKFMKDLGSLVNYLANMLNDGLAFELRLEYCQRLMSAYVGTKEFVDLDPARRSEILEYHHTTLSIFDNLNKFLTKDMEKYAYDFDKLISNCSLPKYSIDYGK